MAAPRKYTPAERIRRDNARGAKYRRENYTPVLLQFRKDSDADVLGWLDAQPNKKQAIARLIREAIAKGE